MTEAQILYDHLKITRYELSTETRQNFDKKSYSTHYYVKWFLATECFNPMDAISQEINEKEYKYLVENLEHSINIGV